MPLLYCIALEAVFAAEPQPVRVVSTSEPIAIDGVLDEASWALAEPVTDFARYLPAAGGAPAGRTEVRFLQDAHSLYIGVEVRDADYVIRARISPREDMNADDQVGIYLDTFGDERTGYIFYISALGIQQDIRFNNGDWNLNWNTVLRSRGRATEHGYTIEVAIPFRSLRYPSTDGPQTWGLILTRKIPSEGAKYAYPEITRRHPRLFSQAAPLVGVEPAPQGAGLELLPSLALRQDAVRPAAGEGLDWSGLDPWQDAVRPGVDLRLGLGPDGGLAATVNPDFSQVEGDPTQIDLNQRFAFFLDELRPFFLDGIDAFQDIQGTLYTRSITDPIYGLKLSGDYGPLTLGVLQAVDRAPAPSVNEAGTPGFSEGALEDAAASDAFVRARLDAFGGGYAGLSIADKRVLGSGARNDVLGLDMLVPAGETWTGKLGLSGSLTEGEGQRLRGHNATLGISRSVATGWWIRGGLRDTGPGYRNELGFFTQSGVSEASAEGGYTAEPGAALIDVETTGTWIRLLGERDGDYIRSVGAYQWATLAGVHQPSGSLELFSQRQDGVDFQGWSAELGYKAEPTGFLSFAVGGKRGSQLDYELLVPAAALTLNGEVTLRIGAGGRINTTLIQAWFTPEGQATESATAIRSRAYWQFTPTLGARVIGETTADSGGDGRAVTLSYLLTWLRNPGTEAYLGATQSYSLDAPEALEEQTLFAKMTWLFRV